MAELGERVANLEARLDAQSQDLADIRDSIRRLDDRMEARFGGLDARFASIDTRFTTVDTRFMHLEARMETGFRDIRSEMHSNFRWIMGGIGGAIFAVLISILAQVLTR